MTIITFSYLLSDQISYLRTYLYIQIFIASAALKSAFVYNCHIKYFQKPKFISLMSWVIEYVSLITYLLNFNIFLSENKLVIYFSTFMSHNSELSSYS